MNKEDKFLLLQDLSARLPYGVKCCIKNNCKISGDLVGIVGENISLFSSGCGTFNINIVKPYLRPMSSMTEEEEFILDETRCWTQLTLESYDWLNAHHFDYRNLIEKGLAIEAPEGMYK